MNEHKYFCESSIFQDMDLFHVQIHIGHIRSNLVWNGECQSLRGHFVASFRLFNLWSLWAAWDHSVSQHFVCVSIQFGHEFRLVYESLVPWKTGVTYKVILMVLGDNQFHIWLLFVHLPSLLLCWCWLLVRCEVFNWFEFLDFGVDLLGLLFRFLFDVIFGIWFWFNFCRGWFSLYFYWGWFCLYFCWRWFKDGYFKVVIL